MMFRKALKFQKSFVKMARVIESKFNLCAMFSLAVKKIIPDLCFNAAVVITIFCTLSARRDYILSLNYSIFLYNFCVMA
jgi:hypothetical protein